MFWDNILDIIIGIVFSIFFTLLGTVLVINCRSIYYHDIDMLGIEKEVNLDKETIKDNYDSLMDYLSPFSKSKLEFSDFTQSNNGISHFKDVKSLIRIIYILTCIFGIITIITILIKAKKSDIQYLFLSSICTAALPIVIGLYLLYDFNNAFANFHKLIFKNDYWLFDPYTDPIINILPENYFLHCGISILCFSCLAGICMFIIYKGLCRKYFPES